MPAPLQAAAVRLKIKGTNIHVRPYFKAEYDAASQKRRARGWMPSMSAPNSNLWGLATIRRRSRDLSRNLPIIEGAYDSLVANLVGPGIVVIPRRADPGYRTALKELWEQWKAEADADNISNFDELVCLAVHTMLEAGECFIRHRPRRTTDGLTVPYQIQLIEPEHVPTDKNEQLPGGGRIIAGVEFNAYGRRVAYHVYRDHPGESVIPGSSRSLETTRVPAEEIIHLYRPRRPGQVRGLPVAASAIMTARDWQEYSEAELIRKKTTSMLVGFVTRPASEEPVLGEFDFDDTETPEDDTGMAALEPGTMQFLEPGEDVKFSAPTDSGPTYEAYVKGVLRSIAAAFGLTYEQLTQDLTGVNFSSIRAGLNEFQRRARRWQKHIIHQLLVPVWERFVREAVLVGAIEAQGMAFAPREFTAAHFVAPGWRYVNPQQEVAADKESIRAGLASRSTVAAERGYDVEEIDRQNAADLERQRELGLNYDINGAKAAPAAPPPQGQEDDGNVGRQPNETEDAT